MPIFNQALIIFNKDKTRFTIPRKDTAEYNEVMKIMNDLKANAKKEPKTAAKTAAKKATKKTKATIVNQKKRF